MPAMAQQPPVADVTDNTAKTVYNLTANLLPESAANELVTGLDLEAFNWTASVGVGDAARCAYDKGSHSRTFNWETKQWEGEDRTIVGYHIEDDKYNKGEPIARACTYYESGRLRNVRGGWFTVRLWGKVCYPNDSNCDSLQGGLSKEWLRNANTNGYHATFKPGPNCGPAAWPTPELKAMFPNNGYAEWCDFTVRVPNFP